MSTVNVFSGAAQQADPAQGKVPGPQAGAPRPDDANASAAGAAGDARRGAPTPGRTRRLGGFGQILQKMMGMFRRKPVALVRPGQEVSFERIPFVDPQGGKLKIRGSAGQLNVQRGGRAAGASTLIRKELALSRNRGVAQPIPAFGSRAKKVLADTAELRRGILSGEIETPGNRGDILRRRLKEEAAEEGTGMVDQAWLMQIRQHMARIQGEKEGGTLLKANAAAMSGSAGGTSGKGARLQQNAELVEKGEQADPRKTTVRRFQPPRIDPRTGENLPPSPEGARGEGAEKPAMAGEKAGEARPDLLSALRKGRSEGEGGAGEGRRGREPGSRVVSRITFERRESLPPNPAENEQRSRRILQALRGSGSEQAGDGRGAAAGRLENSEESVERMKLRGWHVGGMDTSSENDEPQETARGRGDAREGREERRPMGGDSRRLGDPDAEKRTFGQAVSAKAPLGGEARAQAGEPTLDAPAAGRGPQAAMNAGQAMRAAQGDPAQGQAHDASRGMQNLQEVLQKMEANAKLLTGDGRTTLQVRLKPARLGTLFVQIERRDGGYEVRLRASNDQGTRAIERQLPVIREQLAQQGIQVERFEVQQPAAERQEGDSQRQMMQEQRQQQEQARDRSARPGDRDRSGGKRFGWRTSEDGTPEGATPEDRPGRLSLGTNTMEVTY